MNSTYNNDKQTDFAYTIVPYSTLKPSLDTADSTNTYIAMMGYLRKGAITKSHIGPWKYLRNR